MTATALGRRHTVRHSASGIVNPFADRCAVFVQTALHLSDCKIADNFPGFKEGCDSVGITGDIYGVEAAQGYWQLMLPVRAEGDIYESKTNSILSDRLGIQLMSNDMCCRNRLLYHLFELIFDDLLSVDIFDGPHLPAKQAKANAERIREGKVQPHPMRRVVLHDIRRGGKDPWYFKIASIIRGEALNNHLDHRIAEAVVPIGRLIGDTRALQLGNLLYKLQMILPEPTMAHLLGSVIQKGLNGEKITLAGAFCPDYAYEETGNPNLPYRYTFDNVGIGVGLVAQQFQRVTPALSAFFDELGIEHEIVLGIGDFEADSEKILKKVQLTYDEFVHRCSQSLEAFAASMPQNFQVKLELCDADRCKGRLRTYAQEAKQRMMSGDFGMIGELYGEPNQLVEQIVQDSATFYRRWYDRPDMTELEIRELVLGQGSEYSALSRVYEEDFGQNLIIISGDRPMMHCFDSLWRQTPELCVKRAY